VDLGPWHHETCGWCEMYVGSGIDNNVIVEYSRCVSDTCEQADK